jgi:uncharacterized protein (TIRG00374 family)
MKTQATPPEDQLVDLSRSSPKKVLRARFFTLLKLVFVALLLYYLAQRGFISVHATQTALTQWQMILPAFSVLLLTAFLGVFRWQWLLQAQGIHLRFSRVLQLTLIGTFFNIALPGAVSGDLVKAFYVGKETGGKKSRAFGSILFDRVAGLSALVLVSASSLALGFKSFLNSPLFSAIQVLLGVAACGVVFFYGYLFLVREHHDPVFCLLRSLEIRFPKTSAISRIYASLRHYHNHRLTVLKVLLLSMFIHLCVGWVCSCFAQALGETHLPLLSLYVVVPLGLLMTAIPIAPAGVGTGNIAFLYFFHLMGSERGADVFSLMAVSNIVIGSLGGLVYFKFRTEKQVTKNE